jgi:cytochrome c556
MMRTVLAVTALALGISTAIAQDPIAARKALMKENGKQAGQGAKFIKGEEAFDLAKAKAIFAAYADSAAKVAPLFPDTAKTGGDTAALPAIWEKKADFDAKLAKFATESKAAGEATKDLDSFKLQVTEVRKNCGGCHQTYRKKAS